MWIKSSKNLFSIACLSLAVGLSLYWIMFMNILPKLMKPAASNILPLMSAIIGAAVCSLLYLGLGDIITSFRSRTKAETDIVLRRDSFGRVISVGRSDQAIVVRRYRMPEEKPGSITERGDFTKHLKVLRAAAIILLILEAYFIIAFICRTLTPLMAVPSESMVPTLNVGDLVLVTGVDVTSIKEGEIIVFNVPAPYDKYTPSPIIHRVVEVKVEDSHMYFRTKGDNTISNDPWLVPAENVIGKMAAKVPYLGLAVLALKTPAGLTITTALMLLWILNPYITIWRRKMDGQHA